MAGIIKRLIGPHVLIMLIGTAARAYSRMTNGCTWLWWVEGLGSREAAGSGVSSAWGQCPGAEQAEGGS